MKSDSRNKYSLIKIFEGIVNRFGWRMLIGLGIAAGFLLVFGWLAEEVFEGDTRIFDESIRNFIHELAAPKLTALMKFFSIVGSPLVLFIFGIIVIAVFLHLKEKRALILFLITMIGEILLEVALKQFFGRVRPVAFFDYPLPLSSSFPSGHAFGSLCFFGILGLLVIERCKEFRSKLIVAVVSTLLILSIGFSRIYLGVHYPSDVLAGYAAGLFWIFVIALIDAHWHRSKNNEKSL